jgi:predicted transglutaminase-like cysteine proteinase
VLLCVALLVPTGPAGAAQGDPDLLFGAHELHSTDLALFPKWRGAIARYHAELQSCDDASCDRKAWGAFIARLRGLDRMSQIAEVNRELNRHPYILDPANWGIADYWETPFQFLRRSGDCEDYAIAKYMALRALEVPKEALRIVVLQDLNLRLAHAVLVVYVDGRALVLDNQIASVVPADSIHHYRPIYAVNEDGWWLYRP